MPTNRASVRDRMRRAWSQGRFQALIALVLVSLAVAVILPRLPSSIAAVGTLDECFWGWPVVAFEGEDWKGALPADLLAIAPRQIPIAEWPSGMRFDEAASALLDGRGDAIFRKGDRVKITGSVIHVHGDPSPCFYTLGVKVEAISSP